MLERCDIGSYFDVRISGDMVTRCKPDPEIFLTAASALGLAPEECMVFEDAVSGIAAAKAAGMKVVALTTTHNLEQLTVAAPNLIINDFSEITLDDIKSIYEQ